MFIVTKQDGTVVELPAPKTATPGSERIRSSESGRNQKGKMFLYTVAPKFKWTNTWGPLTPTQMATILDAVDDDRYEWFYLTYPHPKTQEMVTGEFYAGPYTAPVLWWNPLQGKKMYAGLNLNFIEM